MNDSKHNDGDIEALLKAAGTRTQPPPEMRERVHAHVLEAWQDLPETQSPRKGARSNSMWWRKPQAIAASTLVVIGFALVAWQWVPMAKPQPIATVVFSSDKFLHDGEWIAAPSELLAQYTLHVPPHRMLTLKMNNGAMLTVGGGSRMTLIDAVRVQLDVGRVYVDSDDSAAQISVQTPFSTITDIGTQFEVAVDKEKISTAVRSGHIEIATVSGIHVARADNGMGERVRLNAGAVTSVEPLASDDAYWQWRTKGRAPYQLAGSTVYDYLHWAARDSGRSVMFRRGAVRQAAMIESFRGSDVRKTDELGVADILETTTLKVLDPKATIWEVDFRQ